MELKVWVEGIQRVICGVTEETTCQDVVIALAHATGRTGRFTLIEKWRDNERLVPPAECPLKLLRNWGEYAGDVQYLLKFSGDKRMHNSEKFNGNKPRTDSNKFLHNFSPHHPFEQHGNSSSLANSQYPQIQRPNVKRNLTFSGAHQSNVLSPLRGTGHNQRKLPPFENSSLDSVEEQSSLSSHSSSSPYSSFQSGESVSRNHHSYSQRQETKNQSTNRDTLNFNNRSDMPIATSSVSSTPVTSPIETPTNSLERLPQNEPIVSGSPLTTSGQDNTQSIYTHRRDHLFSPPVRYQKQPAPNVLAKSLDTAQLRKQFTNSEDISTHSSSHKPASSSLWSPLTSKEQTQTRTNQTDLQYNQNHQYQKYSDIYDSSHGMSSVEDTVHSNSNQLYHNNSSSENNSVLLHSNSSISSSNSKNDSNLTQAFTQQQQYQHNKVDSSSSETDENKNSKKTSDLSALLESREFSNVSRDDLVRLVNLQIERLNSYEDKLKNIDSEISFHEHRDVEAVKTLQHIKSENTKLMSHEAMYESELQELEIVSWEDKLELERKNEVKLQNEVETLQNKLSKCEIEVVSHRQKCDHLQVEIEGERKLQTKQQHESKEKEIHTLQEVSDLQKQINQKLVEHEANEKTLEEWGSQLKKLESGILEKKASMSGVERDLKDVNLQLFNLKPVAGDGKNTAETNVQHIRQGSESGVPFARSSSSRAVSTRKIPSKQISLKEAIESEPQGYWV